MSALMGEYEKGRRRAARFWMLLIAAFAAGVGVWLTLPYGIVLVAGDVGAVGGWGLAMLGAALLAGVVAAGVAAARVRVPVTSSPGKPNERFDRVDPSPDPEPGVVWSGAKLGSM
ncbi:hypothetical protein P5G50_09930 [Leifsonia sp. F6_8S_P_1B]|uniref:Uncharacterized protein n=1 Tax=Leifsonia williamsii TaxID=3035919 RepID=A0ABT8KCS6_9MICO|nr:hypothetical protein [Leifsonia williamsii]MDN4614773.1 hypothetical protein [Leifsonia williamsii]